MSSIEDKPVEMDVPSPTFSAISSSSTSDSDTTTSEGGPEMTMGMLDDDDLQQNTKSSAVQEEEEEEEEEEDVEIQDDSNLVIFGRVLPRSPRSTTPTDVEEEEQRAPSADYPQSQRVYSSPSCGISAVLQRQSSDLWMQFDNIGTEMIVTRRGR